MDKLTIAGKTLDSRLLVGTGKFTAPEVMAQALAASEADIVTVALRRVDIDNAEDDTLRHIDRERFLLLPNTSGARSAEEAVRLSRLARAATGIDWVKLEVTPDPYYLLPDPIETLKAAETLVQDGFVVLPYINADPILAKRLADLGTATVMPLGSPIGSNQGLKTRAALEIIIEQSSVPVVVDAGLRAPSEAASAMELGCDAVLVNSAVAAAADPVAMARCFARAVETGFEARRAGIMERHDEAVATSPLTAFLDPEEA